MPAQQTGSTPSFLAYVAIDWADRDHVGALRAADSAAVENFPLKQAPEAIDAWVAALRTRFGAGPIALALEQSKGALIYALMKHEGFVLYPINPKQLACFRAAMSASGAKSDPHDAAFLLELLVKHREHLRAWRPDDQTTRLIGQLAEDRRGLIGLQTRLSNTLKSRLKQYFPLALDVLGELDGELACRFLLRWNSLADLQRETPEAIAAFYRERHCHHPQLIATRLEAIRQATPLVTDSALIRSGQLLVETLATELLALIPLLERYDRELAALMKQHPDAELFRSFPGAGDALAPRLLATFGTDRERLQHVAQMQSLSGVAPVTRASGQSRQVTRRWACNKFLLQTFHEFAQHSIPRSAWDRAYYQHLRKRGKKHHAAIRGLAFKWVRVLFRCWQDRTLYNEAHYLARLQKNGAPLLEHLQPSNRPIPGPKT